MGRKREIPEKKTPEHPQAEHTFYEFEDIFNGIETNSLWSSTSFVTVNSGLNSIHLVVLFQVFKCLAPDIVDNINVSSQTTASMSKKLYLNFCLSLALFLHLLVDLI